MDAEIAVVGKGMIGSAAARHLAESGRSVALIGPDEPEDRRSWAGPFCSHPDEGRITRIAGRSPVWSLMAARSIERYEDIAARSGIDFHDGRGLVVTLPAAQEWVDNGAAVGGDARLVDPRWVADTTGIVLSGEHPVLYEGAPAGHINPRRLVAAQVRLAAAAGARVVTEAVTALVRHRDRIELRTATQSVEAQRVLLATGAFGSELLDVELDVRRSPRTTVTAEIADDGRIPSLICMDPPDERLEDIYWVPPVRYPDGRVALKIGGSLRREVTVSPAELGDWFRGEGDPTEIDALQRCVEGLLPGVEVRSWAQRPCVVTNTPSDHPYIGWVDDEVAVAIGGNGAAAKSSDEIGRLAATLFAPDGWTDEIDAATFAPRS